MELSNVGLMLSPVVASVVVLITAEYAPGPLAV
jgi:hypothetical protein